IGVAMKSIINIIKQQLVGVISLSMPFIILSQIYPTFFDSILNIIVCCIGIGFFTFYRHWSFSKNFADNLKFEPTGACKNSFEQTIIACGIDPKTVRLRYGYSSDAIASATFTTILIDPLLWSGLVEDPEALKTLEILNVNVVSALPELQKQRVAEVRQALTEDVQRFIFKHELGHIVYNYSYKRLITVGIIGALMAWSGFITATALYSIMGKVSVILAIVIAAFADLFLAFCSNPFLKVAEERKADIFAARNSTAQEIEAAAEFFERHQEIVDRYAEDNLLSKLSPEILSGHPHGKRRSAYLRKLALQKAT
ncbi:MAG TPA: M48 family metalloprotease, partial [Candidatus Babeliaceae bacterium]|nr:M48 family metalloprotease [Candidatus Babeliaceae bacterium]